MLRNFQELLVIGGLFCQRGGLRTYSSFLVERKHTQVSRFGSLFVVLLFLSPLSSIAQDSVTTTTSTPNFTQLSGGEKSDSVQKLPSTLFLHMPPQVGRGYLSTWQLTPEAWRYDSVTVDTLFSHSHLFEERLQTGSLYTHTGLRYAPLQYDEFFLRTAHEQNLPPSFRSLWEHLRAEHRNYSAQGPYSHFNAAKNIGSGEGELYARWFYTQNLSPGLNFGFNLLHAEDVSDMINLKSRYNVGELFGSFVYGRFYLSASASLRRMEHHLNGGMTSVRWLLDTVVAQGQIPTYHTNNNTLAGQDTYTIEASYDLVQSHTEHSDSLHSRKIYDHSLLSLLLLQEYRTLSRTYIEPKPPETRSYNIANNYTHDSVHVSEYNGRFGIGYRHNEHIGYSLPTFRLWGGYHYEAFSQPQALLYLRGYAQHQQSSLYVGGNADYRLRILHLGVYGYWYGWGARAGDWYLGTNGNVTPLPHLRDIQLRVSFAMNRSRAHYLEQVHFSNTASWDLRNKLLPRTYLHMGGELRLPWAALRLGMQNRLYRNYSYFDKDCRPSQSPLVNILAGYIQEDFVWNGVNLSSRLAVQKSSEPLVLALPLLSVWGSVGYELDVVPNVMRIRLALACNYRTAYYADTYDVPLGIYHRQSSQLLGNYPFLDLLLNVKWKTANLFVMVGHLNDDWFSRNSFVGIGYPERERYYRFGFQWYFQKPEEEEKAFGQ